MQRRFPHSIITAIVPLLFTLAVTADSLPTSALGQDIDPVVILERWRDSLQSDAMQKARVQLQVNGWRGVEAVPTLDSRPDSESTLDVVRSGTNWRTHFQQTFLSTSGSRRVETITTDQYLSLQASVADSTVSVAELIPRLTGKTELAMSDRWGAPNTLMAGFIFGHLQSHDNQNLPQEMLTAGDCKTKKQSDDSILLTAITQHARIQCIFEPQLDGMPREIVKTDKSHSCRISQIQWNNENEVYYPVSYIIATHAVKKPNALTVDYCRVSKFEVNVSIRESDLRPSWKVTNGTPVSVNDAPFPCEYQNGRIVPAVATNAGLSGSKFERPVLTLSSTLLAVGILLLAGAAIFVVKRAGS